MLECKLCNFKTEKQISLSKHTSYYHQLKFPDYLIQVKYKGIKPTCACGCGEETRYEASIADFCKCKHGHQSRLKGHWGDLKSEKRVHAIIKTRKKKFASGEYNHILEHVSKKRSKEIVDKISKTQKQRWEDGNIGKRKYKTSKLEITFRDILDLLDIKYETNFYAKDIKAFYDIYIPSKKLVIEVDGDFWHCNPTKYKNGPTNKCQIINLLRDKEKEQWLKDNGYKLLRFWESDINNNILEVKRILLENLK